MGLARGGTDSSEGTQEKTSCLVGLSPFLIIAIIAAVLGFGGIAGAATGIAKILFVLFLVLFIGLVLLRTPSRLAGCQEKATHA